MTERLGVMLVDDHMIVRTGLSQLLGSLDAFTVVAEAESGEEALYLYRKHRPDVVLMDVRMPGMGGIAAVETLCRHHPDACVVALSTFFEPATIGQMMASGARAFLAKTISADLLAEAIVRVSAGERLLFEGEALVPSGEGDFLPPKEASGVETSPLGAQQRRVLALLSKGFSNAQIGEYIGISVATVRYHVSVILQKLGVTNRAEAVAISIRDGLFTNEDF